MDSTFSASVAEIGTAAAALFAGFGLVLNAIGLWYASGQVAQSRAVAEASKSIAQAEFLLHLEELLKNHQQVHIRLRPGGSWSADAGPKTAEEWSEVEGYMGLFERINALRAYGLIGLDLIEQFYGYRVENIAANPVIRQEKLEKRAEYWTGFLTLLTDVRRQRSERSGR